MKIGALIGSILMIFSTAFMFIIVMTTLNSSVTPNEFMNYIENFGIPGIAFMVMYVTMILVFLLSISSKKIMIIIGSVFCIFGVGAMAFSMFGGHQLFDLAYVVGDGLLILGGLLSFIGFITFRKHNKITIITSFLVFLGFCSNLAGHFLSLDGSSLGTGFQTYILFIAIQAALLSIHSLVFSFSKKKVRGRKLEDEDSAYSVDAGNAFASYMPYEEETDNKHKKKKKSKKSDDFDFNF
ncbi:MAG: hypothetical protein ACTSVU_10095 [Promethearchaeota archaeon]